MDKINIGFLKFDVYQIIFPFITDIGFNKFNIPSIKFVSNGVKNMSNVKKSFDEIIKEIPHHSQR
jgi:hypothetical protein